MDAQEFGYQGFLNIDKPVGMGSTDVVREVKKLFPKRTKVGHGGTLDPMAEGVLPVAIGSATKLLSMACGGKKTYIFCGKFGQTTDTLDREGKKTTWSKTKPTKEAILRVLPRFIGLHPQVPPDYSALKKNGRRAYDLARRGERPELDARPVWVYTLELCSHTSEQTKFLVQCGAGMYVRALLRDIAHALGTVAYVTALRRTQVGSFGEKTAISIESLRRVGHKDVRRVMVSAAQVLDGTLAFRVSTTQAADLRMGRRVSWDARSERPIRGVAFLGTEAVAVVRCEGGELSPERVLSSYHEKGRRL